MLKVGSVTAWHFKNQFQVTFPIFISIGIVAWCVTLFAMAQVRLSHAQTNAPDDKIHITADRMVVDNQTQTAKFSGRVRAVQGTFIITSQILTIYYDTANTGDDVMSQKSDSIDKIVANGDVKILLDDKVATTQTAEYRTDTRVLVLSGPGSKIISEKNSITGATITFYRTDERVIVEGQAGKRVEAEFFPQENE